MKYLAIAMTALWCSAATAYEHHDSAVDFIEYQGAHTLKQLAQTNATAPRFVLFSAEWCHWCHEFAEHTLARDAVATYLNQNFVNVFIDVDVHHAAYLKYHATGLPFVMFLNPDNSLYYRYAGTLYADAFVDVLHQIAADTGVGKRAPGMQTAGLDYTPPTTLEQSAAMMPALFIDSVLDSFDASEHGLGHGQKAVQPRTFLYLLEHTKADAQRRAVRLITATMQRALQRIYDPIEGGFYRYAEKRAWQIPHYEKFADLNAGIVLLLYELNRLSPNRSFQQAADKTLAYLNSTLYADEPGVYLSFQVADTRYFAAGSKRQTPPPVAGKVFTARLAATLLFLLQVLDHTESAALEQNIRHSLNFTAEMVMGAPRMYRYYDLTAQQWQVPGALADHAQIAKLFTAAATRFADPRYAAVATKAMRNAVATFYDTKRGAFIDDGGVEYLMELNALLGESLLASPQANANPKIHSIVTHYSRMSEVLEERLWEAVDWDFTEGYVPYLNLLAGYFSRH